MIKLRSYQDEAIESIDKYFIGRRGSNPLIIAPTASGKSLIIAGYFEKQVNLYPQCRFMMLTHQKELIEQNYEKFCLMSDVPANIYSASVGRKETDGSVLFAGIQSVFRKAQEIGKIDVILVDEAHMLPKKGNGMYRTFIQAMLDINPLLKVIGLTATPYRLNNGLLYEGKDRLFDGVAYEIGVKFMLDNNYITPLITPDEPLKTQFDVSSVPVSNDGEYVQYKLTEAMNKMDNSAAITEILAHGYDRKSWLIFCQSIENAEEVQVELIAKGITCGLVTGKTKKKERIKILDMLKTQQIQCVVNVNVLTTGFDAPCIDMVVMLRPTKSTNLYIQMLGRGVRLEDDKINCLVLDFVGNIEEHGSFDAPNVDTKLPSDSLEVGKAPTKICDACENEVHAALRECPFCGTAFPEPEKQAHNGFVSTLDLISSDQPNQKTIGIARMDFHLHRKAGSMDSCRVNYHKANGAIAAYEFLHFEHDGYAKTRACLWWAAVMPDHPLPLTSMQGVMKLAMNARDRINAITVTTNTKYKEVLNRRLQLPQLGNTNDRYHQRQEPQNQISRS